VSAKKHTKQPSVAGTEAARLARTGIATEMLTPLTRERGGRAAASRGGSYLRRLRAQATATMVALITVAALPGFALLQTCDSEEEVLSTAGADVIL
jgi:hypothetical protein